MRPSIKQENQMSEERLLQWKAVVEVWKKMLTERVEENVALKTTLMNILQHNYNKDCLEEIEQLQTKSIREDEIILVLKKEISDLDHLFENVSMQDTDLIQSIDELMSSLQKDIAYTEHIFGLFISEFKDFQLKTCREKKN